MINYSSEEYNIIENIFDENKPILFLVHGFLGSSSDTFFLRLRNYLEGKKINYACFDFIIKDKKLPKLEELIEQLNQVYSKLSIKYNKLYPLGFSQGGGLINRYFYDHSNIHMYYISPLITTGELMEKRLSDQDIIDIHQFGKITKDFGYNRIFVVTEEVYQSYIGFNGFANQPKIKSLFSLLLSGADQSISHTNHLPLVKQSKPQYVNTVDNANHTYSNIDDIEFAIVFDQLFRDSLQ
jgi:hypothetical protein